MTPVTLITGASAGIGAELARVFASHGHTLVLAARREQRLNELAAEIAAAGRAKPLVLAMDLAAPGAAARIGATLAARALDGSDEEVSSSADVQLEALAAMLTDALLAAPGHADAAGSRPAGSPGETAPEDDGLPLAQLL